MKTKVSILVPIYNVSKYIVRCAESLFNQTFTDIEYIFVNDSTPDDSIEKLQSVLEKYPNRKSQVKIIHHTENKGLACARNTALDEADGEYIMVADSDDFLEINAVEVMYNAAIQENADIVVSDFYIESHNTATYSTNPLAAHKIEQLKDIILGNTTYTMWAKLYKKELYKIAECRVPSGLNYHEDIHVMFRLFYYSSKIIKIQQALYHYINYNTNAISRFKNESYFQNSIVFWEQLIIFLNKNNCFDEFSETIDYQKIKNKARLMIDTESVELRKKYAGIFSDIEKENVVYLKKGERFMLFLIRKKIFFLTRVFRNVLVVKKKILNYASSSLNSNQRISKSSIRFVSTVKRSDFETISTPDSLPELKSDSI